MTRRTPRRGALVGLTASLAVMLAACTPSSAEDAAPSTVPSVRATVETPSPSPSPSPSEAPDPLGEGATTVLLIGTDSRDPQSLGGNADTIMLAHAPADRSALYLVSFTRDMHVPIPGLGEGKINSAFARGGTDTLVDTVSGVLGGAEIDAVMQTNFNGFIALTRALDGIKVENQHASRVTVQSTGRVVEFPEGDVTLENTDGLIYVRERKTLPLGDLDRTERQRAAVTGILAGIAERADDPASLAELIPLMAGNVKITGSLDAVDLFDLVPLATRLDRDDVVGLMVPITGFGTVDGASVNLVDEARTAELGRAVREDTLDENVERYGTGYAPTRS
ncbi:LCP family protein [Isoptericola sp. 4D.3]|uniref:LCP family protein n=1 Tax=Isoptericola peretonis TaxID=2918523 RepID=A0ABT0J5G5_9MICO|nr:LCP family protein [Isoptericola sp. 4D.3]